MNDLISRSALISDISEIETNKVFDDKEDILEKVLARIDYQPIVDAKPVVHGVWIEQYGNLGKLYTEFVCSKCKMIYKNTHNYCPNCGARMDGE